MVGALDNERHGGPSGFKTDRSVIEIILTRGKYDLRGVIRKTHNILTYQYLTNFLNRQVICLDDIISEGASPE